MVANPANTNALILKENAPKIPPENVTCLTRLDHNRALGQVSIRIPSTNSFFWVKNSSPFGALRQKLLPIEEFHSINMFQ